jgi:sulfide dehydrogenase cytochrome subunit
MMTQKTTRFALLAGAGLFSLVLASGAWADANKLAENCAGCHGKDGASTESDVPIIGGVSAQFMSDSLAAYKKKELPCRKEICPRPAEIRCSPGQEGQGTSRACL